jgi:hypothetical protein
MRSEQYMNEVLEQKEKQIEKLTKERDDWQNLYRNAHALSQSCERELNVVTKERDELIILKKQVEALATDKSAVWVNMLRGKIAIPSQLVEVGDYEQLRAQRDQVLHLLQGGTLTKEKVTESGLGEGVLIDQRHFSAKLKINETVLAHNLEHAKCTKCGDANMPLFCSDCYNDLRAKLEQADACCAFLKGHLQCIRDFDDDSPWDDPGHCAMDALKRSDDCGKPLLERLERLEEALELKETGWKECAEILKLSQADRDVMRAGLLAIESLIHESTGVAGLHLNGDLAPWNELRTGGRFEDWLEPLDRALKLCQPKSKQALEVGGK